MDFLVNNLTLTEDNYCYYNSMCTVCKLCTHAFNHIKWYLFLTCNFILGLVTRLIVLSYALVCLIVNTLLCSSRTQPPTNTTGGCAYTHTAVTQPTLKLYTHTHTYAHCKVSLNRFTYSYSRTPHTPLYTAQPGQSLHTYTHYHSHSWVSTSLAESFLSSIVSSCMD